MVVFLNLSTSIKIVIIIVMHKEFNTVETFFLQT